MTGEEILFTNPIRKTMNDLAVQVDLFTTRVERLVEENKKLREDAQGLVSEELRKENECLKKRLDLSFGEFNSEKEYKDYLKFPTSSHTEQGLVPCTPWSVKSAVRRKTSRTRALFRELHQW